MPDELLMLLLSHQTLFHYFLINNGVNSCTSGDLKIPRDSFSFNNVLDRGEESRLKFLMFKKVSVRNIQKHRGAQFEHQSIWDKVNNKLIFDSVEFENYLLDYLLVTAAANDERFLGGLQENIEFILLQIENDI